jgi:hypothetical protein
MKPGLMNPEGRFIWDELQDALSLLKQAIHRLSLAEILIARARDEATEAGKPADGYEHLRVELETLVGFINEKGIDTIQKLAEVEAGSLG